jgi:GH18 family chitinase
MRKSLLFFVLICATTLFAQNRVIAYFPHWAQYSQFTPQDVRYNFLTEVRYGYVTPSGQELLFADESDKENFLALVSQAKAAKVKLTIAVGGLGAEEAMKEAYESKSLTEAVKKFQKEYGVDAFELDGGAISAEDLPKLLQQATDLANAGIAVSIAVPGTESLTSAISGADLSKIDNFSLWFTDEAAASDPQVKPNSNTESNIKILAAFANAGVPKNKLVPIIPFYGKTFYKAKGLGSPHEGAGSGNDGVLPYKDIMEKFNKKSAYSVSFDESSKSEVAVSENETIVFNGIPSVKTITEAVKANGYGGVAAFDISGDRKEPIISLLVTIGQVLRPEIDYKKKKK